MITIHRSIGDLLSPLSFQIKLNNVAVNLTNRAVHFGLFDNDGNEIITPSTAGVTVTDAVNGLVDYDFQDPALPTHDNVVAYPNGRDYYGYFYVYDAVPGTEPDTYPPEGIKIVFYSPHRDQTVDSVIDIAGAALAPIRSRTEEGSVQERTIDELIKADQYIKSQNVPDAVPWGIRMARIQYGSTTPGSRSHGSQQP